MNLCCPFGLCLIFFHGVLKHQEMMASCLVARLLLWGLCVESVLQAKLVALA